MFYDCYYFCQLCWIYVHGVPGVSGWLSVWCPRVKLSDLSSLEIFGDEIFLIKKCLQKLQILCGKTI